MPCREIEKKDNEKERQESNSSIGFHKLHVIPINFSPFPRESLSMEVRGEGSHPYSRIHASKVRVRRRASMNRHCAEIVGRGITVILSHGVTLLGLSLKTGEPTGTASGSTGKAGTDEAASRELMHRL